MSHLLDSLDGELFFGREREMERFSLSARDLARGWGKSVMLRGRPGTGKTELLLQFYRHLHAEVGAVVPVYHRFDPVRRGGAAGAAAFVEALASQFLAFRRQDLSLAREGLGTERLTAELRREDDGAAGLLREACLRFAGGTEAADMREAARFPALLARETGWKICLLLDDMHHLAEKGTGDCEAWPGETFRCRNTSFVFTGDSRFLRIMERRSGPGAFETWTLDPLTPEGSLQMARSLLRAAGIELPGAPQRCFPGFRGASRSQLKRSSVALTANPAATRPPSAGPTALRSAGEISIATGRVTSRIPLKTST